MNLKEALTIKPVSWNRKVPLLRVAAALGCLWFASLLLIVFQAKLWLVDGVHLPILFWATVVVSVLLLVFFQGVALVCNKRLQIRNDSAQP
jgi:hypothetical protein